MHVKNGVFYACNNNSFCFENAKRKLAEKYQEGSRKNCHRGFVSEKLIKRVSRAIPWFCGPPRPDLRKTGLINPKTSRFSFHQ